MLLSRLHDGQILVSDLNGDRATTVAGLADATVVTIDRVSISAALSDSRLRYALDATGSAQAISATLDLLSGGEVLALVGISNRKIEIDPNLLVERRH